MNEAPSGERMPSRAPGVLLAIFVGMLVVSPPARGGTQNVPAVDAQTLLVRGEYKQAEEVEWA